MNAARLALLGAFGVLVGGLASSLFTSCACPETELVPVPVGAYVPAEDSPLPADYQVDVADDSRTAVQTYTQDGKSYEIRYRVTRDEL